MSRQHLPPLAAVPLLATLLAAALLTAAPLIGRATTAPTGDLTPAALGGLWRTIANGDRINALLRAGDTVWSATAGGGIVRWDLASGAYRQYLAPQDGLPGNDVRALVRDRQGALWAATSRGLARYASGGDRWSAVNMAGTGIDSRSTTALAVAADGSLWVGFEQRWDPAATVADANTPGAFVGGGLARYDPERGAWGTVLRAEPLDRNAETFATIPSDNVTALAVTGEGVLWVGTRPYFAWRHDSSGTGSGAGQWLRVGGGLAATDGRQWQQWHGYGAKGTCLADQINGLAVDQAQRVWVATSGKGLQAFRAGLATVACDLTAGHSVYLPLRGAARAQGIPDSDAWSVAIGDDGRVWVGAGQVGVAVLDHKGTFEDPSRPWTGDDVWATFGLDGRTAAANATASALSVGADGILIGTREVDNNGDGWGIKVRTTAGAWRTLATAEYGLPSNRITTIAVQPTTGDFWFGTASRGVARWDGTTWQSWQAFGRQAAVGTLIQDAPVGGYEAVLSVDGAAFAAAFPATPRYVRFGTDPTLYEIVTSSTDQGHTRVGVKPALVMPLPAGTPVYTVARGPASDAVAAIAFGADGRVWVGGKRTTWLGRCPTYPQCWLDGGLSAFDGTAWTMHNELPDGQTLGGVQALASDGQGRLWVGTASPNQGASVALATYDPARDAWTVHHAQDGLGLGAVADLSVDAGTGEVWVASTSAMGCDPQETKTCSPKRVGGGIARWNGTQWIGWSKSTGAPLTAYGEEGDFTSILFDRNRGTVWAGAWAGDPSGFHWNSGVGIRTVLNNCRGDCQNGGWVSQDLAADGPVVALADDQAGRLWVGASREGKGIIPPTAGVRLLIGEAWSALSSTASPLPDDNITALAPSGDAMWIGTFDRGAALWRPMVPVAFAYLPGVER